MLKSQKLHRGLEPACSLFSAPPSVKRYSTKVLVLSFFPSGCETPQLRLNSFTTAQTRTETLTSLPSSVVPICSLTKIVFLHGMLPNSFSAERHKMYITLKYSTNSTVAMQLLNIHLFCLSRCRVCFYCYTIFLALDFLSFSVCRMCGAYSCILLHHAVLYRR